MFYLVHACLSAYLIIQPNTLIPFYLPTYLPTNLPVFPLLFLPMLLPFYLSINLSIYLPMKHSVYISTNLPTFPHSYLSIYVSTHLFINLATYLTSHPLNYLFLSIYLDKFLLLVSFIYTCKTVLLFSLFSPQVAVSPSSCSALSKNVTESDGKLIILLEGECVGCVDAGGLPCTLRCRAGAYILY